MPISVKGITDATGAISTSPIATKVVCIAAQKGATDTVATADGAVFDITSTNDAATKFGATSKAVKLAETLINNGVSSIKGVYVPQVGGSYASLSAAFSFALDKLLVKGVDVIILDTADQTIANTLKSHLDLAEAEDKYRYGVIGGSGDNTALSTLATSINHKRMFVTGPAVSDKNGTALDGIYAAAALAALIATQTDDPAMPMNGVEMAGFGGVARVLLKADITALINAGVTPIYTAPSGNPAVYRLVTTYTKNAQSVADPTWQEGTTIFVADYALRTNQDLIKNNYPRTKNVARVLKGIRTDLIANLASMNEMEIIENFDANTVTVVKDPSDAFGALIDYAFDVVTPLYTVTIRQHMKL